MNSKLDLIEFEITSFIESIKQLPNCNIAAWCFGNKGMYILELSIQNSTIIISLAEYDKFSLSYKNVIRECFNKFHIKNERLEFSYAKVKSYTDSNINTYHKDFYIFIYANSICRDIEQLEKTFKEKQNIFLPEIDVVTYYDNNSGSSFMIYEAYGLIFKRYYYRAKYSDFGDDNYIYEILPNSKYIGMVNKPIINISVDPRGHTETYILNSRKVKLENQSTFDFSTFFFDGKSYICINFDEMANRSSNYGRNKLTYSNKLFEPVENIESYILSQLGWALDIYK